MGLPAPRAEAAEAPICEIELELKRGESRAMFELAQSMGKLAPVRLQVSMAARLALSRAPRLSCQNHATDSMATSSSNRVHDSSIVQTSAAQCRLGSPNARKNGFSNVSRWL